MSTEPDDLDAFLAEKATDPAFALHWEALQASDRPATTDQTTQVHGPTPVERARSVVTDTIAAARIRGDGPWTTADAVLTALEREGYTVAPKVVFPHKGMTAEQVAEWWERWIAAARASEAAGGDGSPTPDAGAAQGATDGPAAESEPPVYLVETVHAGQRRWGAEFDDLTDAREYAKHCRVKHGQTRIVRVTREVIQ